MSQRFIMYSTGDSFTVDDKEHEMPPIHFTIENQAKKFLNFLNNKEQENKKLEKELSEMKDKAYEYGECLIWERSSTINEDTEKLRIEIYGKEKAEQLKKQEIEEDKKLYTRKATIHDIKPVWER